MDRGSRSAVSARSGLFHRRRDPKQWSRPRSTPGTPSSCAFTGLSRNHPGLPLTELQPKWAAAREDRLHARRARGRIRKAGAGRRPTPTFTDRVVITLIHLRLAIPHDALAVAYAVDRTTITRAVTQIRPLLPRRGFATPTRARPHTLADVSAYAAAEGVTLRMDTTEIRVRRPRQGRPGRKAFISGKPNQNTIKTTVTADRNGATLWCGATLYLPRMSSGQVRRRARTRGERRRGGHVDGC